jgi:superfamily I DNA and/or RNA helicase
VQVVVSTCATSGLLPLLAPRSSADGGPCSTITFTHIFIDEASQALEPETLVPLSLAGSDTTMVRRLPPSHTSCSL